MKAVAGACILVFLLIAGLFGGGSIVITSMPMAADDQRSMYDHVVTETHLEMPGSVLLAVDTVRFRQDFGQVTWATVQQTASLFSACAAFQPIDLTLHGSSQRVAFRVPRPGKVNYNLSGQLPIGTTSNVVDDLGQAFPTGSDLTTGDYWVEIEARDPLAEYRLNLTLNLQPCGAQEIKEVLDRLGLVGDDREMVYHLVAMYLPRQEYHGHIPPGDYAWPVADTWPITEPFGQGLDPVTGGQRFHTGVDIGAPLGTPVHAAADGIVAYAGWDGNYGNVVRIDQVDEVQTVYAHLSAIEVHVGYSVGKFEELGLVGSTGKSTGPHLHFEWRVNGEPVDPLTVYHWTPN